MILISNYLLHSGQVAADQHDTSIAIGTVVLYLERGTIRVWTVFHIWNSIIVCGTIFGLPDIETLTCE